MKVTDTTALGLVLNLFFALFLGAFSIIAFIVFIQYIEDGSSSLPFFTFCCMPLLFVLTIFLVFLNSFNALLVYRTSRSNTSLRVFYFFVFYSLILLLFMLATISELFQSSFILGFPIFITGAIFYPIRGLIIDKEARRTLNKNLLVISCHNCFYTLEFNKQEKERICPLCGAKNMNPFIIHANEEVIPKTK